MKIEKLRKYLKADEDALYKMLERSLTHLGYRPLVKYEEKTYRYNNNKAKGKHAKVSKLPQDVAIYQEPQYLYAEGELPVLLVAHTDIAHSKPPVQVFFDQDAGVMWSPTGLGADDRAGVFAVMELAARFNVGVLFCSGEESGGTGVTDFTLDFQDNNGYKMAIELDRCGIDDCVFYDNNSKEFAEWIQGFGFHKDWGSFSDISILGPSWRINTVNLSVGYEEEHTSREHLFVRDLYRTIDKVSNILSGDIPEFPYEETRWSRSYGYGGWGKEWDDWTSTTSNRSDYKDYCDFCGLYEELNIVEGTYLCGQCFDSNAFDCLACGCSAWKDFNPATRGLDPRDEGMCDECINRYFVHAAGGNPKDKDELAKANEEEGCAG